VPPLERGRNAQRLQWAAVGDAALPLVSIVTPSLQGRYVKEATEIVLATIRASSTSSWTRAHRARRRISCATFPNLHWVPEPDSGMLPRSTKGSGRPKARHPGRLNADDYTLAGAVMASVELIRSSVWALVQGGRWEIEDDATKIGEVAVKPFDHGPRNAYRAVGEADVTYQHGGDYELWLRLGAPFRVGQTDRVPPGLLLRAGKVRILLGYAVAWRGCCRVEGGH
jgi:hypothetical protein